VIAYGAVVVLALAACDATSNSVPRDESRPLPDVTPPHWPDGAAITTTSMDRHGVLVTWDAAIDDRPGVVYDVVHGGRRMRTALLRARLTTVDAADAQVSVVAVDAAGNLSVAALVTTVLPTSSCSVPRVVVPHTIGAGSP